MPRARRSSNIVLRYPTCPRNCSRFLNSTLIRILLLIPSQLQYLSSFGRCCYGTIQFLSQTHNAGNQFRIAFCQLAFAVVNIVFEGYTHMATHGQGYSTQCRLMSSNTGYAPGAFRRQATYQVHKLSRAGTDAARNAQHKIEMWRVVDQTLN